MEHKLIKTNVWHCQVCLWDWEAKPKSRCPGVPRYNWDTKPEYLISQTSLKKLGFSFLDAIAGVVYYSGNEYWNLYDIRQATSKKGEAWESALKRLAVIQEKQKQREALKEACDIFAWRLEEIEKRIKYFGYDASKEIYNLKPFVDQIRNALKMAKQDLIKIQKLIGKYPHPQAAVLGGQQQQGPRPWDAVLGGGHQK